MKDIDLLFFLDFWFGTFAASKRFYAQEVSIWLKSRIHIANFIELA